MTNQEAAAEVVRKFQKRFDNQAEIVVRAPGRVNLIGEHTDYNAGFVLPMAVDRAIWIALRPRQDDMVRLFSTSFPDPAEFSLKNFEHVKGWSDYVRGMAWILADLGFPLRGWEGVLLSTIPIASGLSSSAALELAVARAFWTLSQWKWDEKQMALAASKMENNWLQLKSGVMDQMISSCGVEGHALLLDCRDFSTEVVPVPEGYSIVVMDTGKRRGLVDSKYNVRVEECQTAAKYFGVSHLRDVDLKTLEEHMGNLEPVIYRRARHVVSENERVLAAVAAFQNMDLSTLGELLNKSHESLRDDYEVSCLELDEIVEIAQSQQGCLGARMTGAGFGGCAIALVEKAEFGAFTQKVESAYNSVSKYQCQVYAVEASGGANQIL